MLSGLVFLLARSLALTAPGLRQGLSDALGGAMMVGFVLALVHDAAPGVDQVQSREQEEKGEIE